MINLCLMRVNIIFLFNKPVNLFFQASHLNQELENIIYLCLMRLPITLMQYHGLKCSWKQYLTQYNRVHDIFYVMS